MSDSEQSNTEAILEAIEDSADVLEAARSVGLHPLTGEAKVQLVVTTFEVATPQEAVEVAVRDILRRGLDAFTFAVTDMETGEHFLVRNGTVMTLKDARMELGDYDRPDGEGDDDDSGGTTGGGE